MNNSPLYDFYISNNGTIIGGFHNEDDELVFSEINENQELQVLSLTYNLFDRGIEFTIRNFCKCLYKYPILQQVWYQSEWLLLKYEKYKDRPVLNKILAMSVIDGSRITINNDKYNFSDILDTIIVANCTDVCNFIQFVNVVIGILFSFKED